LFIIFLLTQGAIAIQLLRLVLLLEPSKVDGEHTEACYEKPAQKVVNQTEEGNGQLDLGVQLSNHGHLAAVSDDHLLSKLEVVNFTFF
jgi:hypothetical protein